MGAGGGGGRAGDRLGVGGGFSAGTAAHRGDAGLCRGGDAGYLLPGTAAGEPCQMWPGRDGGGAGHRGADHGGAGGDAAPEGRRDGRGVGADLAADDRRHLPPQPAGGDGHGQRRGHGGPPGAGDGSAGYRGAQYPGGYLHLRPILPGHRAAAAGLSLLLLHRPAGADGVPAGQNAAAGDAALCHGGDGGLGGGADDPHQLRRTAAHRPGGGGQGPPHPPHRLSGGGGAVRHGAVGMRSAPGEALPRGLILSLA